MRCPCKCMDTMSCMKTDTRSNRVGARLDGDIYHEKQARELCALHALNNLFQDDQAFSKSDLDSICYKLSPSAYINPHKSLFGLGNYDVNVVMAALQTKGYDTVWFDKRKDIESLSLDNIIGYILNVPTDYKWGIIHLPVHRKHWITVRKIGDHYYNLDSKLDAPEMVGRENELRSYLREQVECREKELLLVVKQDIAQNGTWIRAAKCLDGKGEKVKRRRDREDQSSRRHSENGPVDHSRRKSVDRTDKPSRSRRNSSSSHSDARNSGGSYSDGHNSSGSYTDAPSRRESDYHRGTRTSYAYNNGQPIQPNGKLDHANKYSVTDKV